MTPNNKLILAVNGTLMRGLELENNLKAVNATFIKESQTEKAYRLYSINDQYPAMIKHKLGTSIDVELYEISEEGMKEVLSKEPKGLTIKKIKLIDGTKVYGVVGLPFIVKNRREITTYGGWRNYLSYKKNQSKKLFLYYSNTGNGDIVAEVFKVKGYDIRKIDTVHHLPKSFFWSVMTGGFQAGMNLKAKLKPFDQEISGYEEVVIGSPIWNGKFPPALNTLLAVLDLSKIKLSFVFYSGSGEGLNALKRVQSDYPNADYTFLKEPKKYPNELEKLN